MRQPPHLIRKERSCVFHDLYSILLMGEQIGCNLLAKTSLDLHSKSRL